MSTITNQFDLDLDRHLTQDVDLVTDLTIDLAADASTDAEKFSRIAVWAPDGLVAAGLAAAVRSCVTGEPSVHVGARGVPARTGEDIAQQADVVVVAAGASAAPARQLARAAAAAGAAVVWIAHTPGDHRGAPHDSQDAVPVAGLLRRSDLVGGSRLELGLRALLLGGRWPAANGATREAAGEAANAGAESTELDEREIEVLRLLAAGSDTAEVASHLYYSERTVKNVVSRAVRQLGVRNRAQAVAVATRRGLL